MNANAVRLRDASILGLLALAITIPMLALAVWSFGRGWFYPRLLPERFDVEAWRMAVGAGGRLFAGASVSTGIAAIVAAIAVIAGVPAGRLLSRRETRTIRRLEWLLLFPAIAPPVVLGTGIQYLFIVAGLAGTVFGVVLAHLIPVLPFATLIASAIAAQQDARLEDVARSLGASEWQTIRHVILPSLREGAGVVALFAFLISWSQYALTIEIGGGRIETLPMLVFDYIGGGNPQFAATAGLVMILPTLAIVALAHRRLTDVPEGQW